MRNWKFGIRRFSAAFMAMMVMLSNNTTVMLAESDIQASPDPQQTDVDAQPAEENAEPAAAEQPADGVPHHGDRTAERRGMEAAR